MHWTAGVFVSLLNIAWIVVFWQPEPFSVSVRTRSVDSDDGTLFGEFCIQLRSDIAYNETNSTDTSEESGPRNFTGHEGSNLTDVIGSEQPATSLQPEDADLDPDPSPLSEVVLTSPAAEHKPSIKSETTFHRSHGSDGTGPDDCCFEFYPRRISKKLIRSYYMTDHRCTKTGVILVTQKAHHFCVDPSLSWVESIMTSLDERFIT